MKGEIFYYNGVNYLEEGKYELAIAEFQKAERDNYKNAALYNDWGLAFAKLNNYQKAIDLYSKAISIDSKYGLAYYNIGSIMFDLDKYDEAISCFNLSIENNSLKLWDCYYMLAHSQYSLAIEKQNQDDSMNGFYESRQLFSQSIPNIEKAILLSPTEDKDLYFLAGCIYKKNGSIEKAKNYWTKAKYLGDTQAARFLSSL